MKSVLQLIDEALMGQVTRMQIAYKAIMAGQWSDAAFTLNNAARESEGDFSADCLALVNHCTEKAGN